MKGRELQGLAAVDKSPDRRRVRPANLSKVGAEASSLHVIQSFNAHSGAGPLPGIAFASFSSATSSVLFGDEVNLSRSVAGKSYHLFFDSVELVSVTFTTLLPPPTCIVVPITHEPKQFRAVFQEVSAQSFAQSWVNPIFR